MSTKQAEISYDMGKIFIKVGHVWSNGKKICLPKKSGGLGVLDLKQQNRALMIKNMYTFYNCRDIPWVQLVWRAHYDSGTLPDQAILKGSHWWRSCIALLDELKQITTVIPGNGHSIHLWSDKWSDKWNASNLHSKFPQLFLFAKNKKITLQYAVQQMQEDRFNMFHTPLSTIVDEQCTRLQNTLNCLTVLENETMEKDKWSLDGNNGKYSTKKVYLAITKPNIAPAPFMWIWDSACLPKHKFFFWLLIQDRLNTKELMKRKKFFVDNQRCILCDDNTEECMTHLFFECDFSRNFWWKIGIEWNTDLDIMEMHIDANDRISNIFFKETMMVGCWSIWNQRNKIIFENSQKDIELCYAFFKLSMTQERHKVKPGLKEGMQDWIDTL
jgi:hypothetical protein